MVLLFINEALAQSPQGGDPGWGGLIIPLVIFGFFYFFFIFPQQKKAKERKKMLESLKKGMEVVTSGGIVGKITDLDETFVVLEVASGVRLPVQRTMIAAILPKGTLKALEKKFSQSAGGR